MHNMNDWCGGKVRRYCECWLRVYLSTDREVRVHNGRCKGGRQGRGSKEKIQGGLGVGVVQILCRLIQYRDPRQS